MNLDSLNAISPVDGRYRNKVESLSNYFSEAALIKYRVRIEVEYFVALNNLRLPGFKPLQNDQIEALRKVYLDFDDSDAEVVKEYEAGLNHDVKAVEYFLKEKLDELKLAENKEFVHFGLTSQDINNTAVPLSMKDFYSDVFDQEMGTLIKQLESLAYEWEDKPMLAHTHGQPASPTSVGKEIYVFVERLKKQFKLLQELPVEAKFGGATGNFNAHLVTYPEIDWVGFANRLVKNQLGLVRQQVTTQIEHYDMMAAHFHAMIRINNIMVDLCRDLWTYIAMEYFKQKIVKGEVGSSAMPHKVNPIDFENAEGNLGIANSIFDHLASKLPISRMQRDLTDSTVTRNIGVPFAHTLIAVKSLLKGLGKLILNEEKLNEDLNANYAVLAEAIQSILRADGFEKPYEKLKDLTRSSSHITNETIQEFIQTLEVSEQVKKKLLSLTPFNYTGIPLRGLKGEE